MVETRTRNREATHAALLEAAKITLAEQGFQNFGVNAVARQAGCDKQLIYRYFGGLDGLLEAMGGDVATWLGAPPTAVPGTTYGEWAANLADAYMMALRANPLLQKLILWELSAAPGTLAPLTQARSRAMMQWVAAARGELEMPTDAGLINAVLVAAIQQFVLSAAVSGSFSGLPLREDADWDHLRAGLRSLVLRLYS
ncbi:TetR/AcrR family transcriptional regulator [Asticcacaulis biprosthecium]|nr:TetR/AcrR family transcriptional regulator [Asticcacaulis biprosthecium]